MGRRQGSESELLTYNYLTECLACGGKELKQYLDLGRQVFANTYPKEYRVDSVLPSAPLQVNLCLDCYHSQLSVIANPKELFRDYLYVSGTTKDLADHFRSLVTQSLPMKPVDQISVLDIGANDYSLLREFKRRGCKVEGVDPASNLADRAGDIPALVDFWGMKTWYRVKQAPYDLITGLNVFAHNLNPLEFLQACREVLKPAGKILLEMPTIKHTLQGNKVGQIYHEHISYFSIHSMVRLVERAGMRITDLVDLPHIHEGTTRFIIENGSGAHSPKVQQAMLVELIAGLEDFETYKFFGETVKANIRQLEELLRGFKSKGVRVVAYGASAKLSTLLGAFKDDPKKSIDYIVDNNPLKVGRHQTNTEIPILPPESMKVDQAGLVILITPDNFFREIKQRLTDMNLGDKVSLIRYVPTISVEELR